MNTQTVDIVTQDLVYLRHGDRAMSMRVFRPHGDSPFPAVLNLHGGAWTKGDLNECEPRDVALAQAGIVSAALDFRHAGDGYPSSLADINYAIRWLKQQARSLGIDPKRIGLAGQSSGGHLAMLSAMRPGDPRYAAIALSGEEMDASVRCVGMTWPVINPLSRYRYAKRLLASANPPAWPAGIPERHDVYWKSEAAMAEGNPMLALERGEKVETPPALWFQGRPDPIHDYLDVDSQQGLNEPERFARNYRAAGGTIELTYVEQAERESRVSLETLAAFFRAHL